MEDLQKQDKLAPNSLVNVAGTPVSVVARAGAPKPDISSVDAFKNTLLTARSIVYADPAKGGASGVYFARVLDRLGIADQLRAGNWYDLRGLRNPKLSVAFGDNLCGLGTRHQNRLLLQLF